MEERGTAAWVTEMRTTLSHFCTGPTGGRKSSQVHTTQTHKRFKRMRIYYDIDNTMQKNSGTFPSLGHKTTLKQQ